MTAIDCSALRCFSIWHDSHEQWDPNDIDVPDLQCKAKTFADAAEALAEDADSSYGEYIVRDDESGEMREITLARAWNIMRDAPTTIAKLSEP